MRLLTRASALAALGAWLTSCSVLLDWGDYSSGLEDAAADDAGDLSAPDAAAVDGDDGGPDANSPEAQPDAGTDAPPPCKTNCNGCCSATGVCQGGQSANSCGTGGETCRNCESTGLACVGGSCETATPSEAGPKTCSLAACNLCIPVWQANCCKSDNTCGCQVLIPKGSCM
jgi:hypothetical protein